jgi:hypothetical protein
MENVSIGIANLIVSNKLKKSYFNDNLIEESKKIAFDFFDVVKNSPVLQLEFKVFNNLESKHIENDQIATRYIDNNIKLFEVYTIEELKAERNKLNPFISEAVIPVDDEKVKLYYAIDSLINESLKISDDVDVDKIHESFTYVLNHIKSPKNELLENVDVEPINEDVIEIAVSKFNEKYAGLDESDKALLKTLIKSSAKEKRALLEDYKTEALTTLEKINESDAQDHIAKAIQKIKEMVYDRKSVDDNIIGLHELKKELL